MNHRSSPYKSSGFTLVELIIVMVVLGVIGAMGAEFISRAFEGFHQTDLRMEIYEEGKTALVRMEREIHIALPNAIDVSDQTVAGDTISLGEIDDNAMAGVFGQYTELIPVGTNIITDRTAGLPAGTLISIHNTGWTEFDNGSRIYQVTSAATNPMSLGSTITMASPYQRFYAVRSEAVRFTVTGTTLERQTAQVNPGAALGAFGNPQPMANNVSQADSRPFFTYVPGTSTRNSVVTIHFAISRNNETVTFDKEVQVRNVP